MFTVIPMVPGDSDSKVPEYVTVTRREEGPVSICPRCGHDNQLGGEIWDTVKCDACQASLWVESDVRYLSRCPICGVSLDEVYPVGSSENESGVNFWTCDKCEDAPRAIFLEVQWMGDEVGACCLCGGPSTMLVFGDEPTGDGEGLCDQCAKEPRGQAKLAKHWEQIASEGGRVPE